MFTYNLHSLLDGTPQRVKVLDSIKEDFDIWLEMYKKTGKEPELLDAFLAGYTVGGNVSLKERFSKIKGINHRIEKTFGGKCKC